MRLGRGEEVSAVRARLHPMGSDASPGGKAAAVCCPHIAQSAKLHLGFADRGGVGGTRARRWGNKGEALGGQGGAISLKNKKIQNKKSSKKQKKFKKKLV